MSKFGGRFNFGPAYAANAASDEVGLRDQAEGDLHRLHREVAALRETLADRETALANAALDAQRSRELWQQESQQALLDAERAWKADEAARFVAAETGWRQQSAEELAETTARCEAAELRVEQLTRKAARERNDLIAGVASAKPDLETKFKDFIGEAPSARSNLENKFEDSVSETDSERRPRISESRIVLRPDRVWANEAAAEQKRRMSRAYAVRGVVGAASLGVLAIGLYFGIGPILHSWRSNTAVVAGASGPIRSGPDIPKASNSRETAVVGRDVNVRANPSMTARVVSTLSRGVKVVMVEQRGSWTLVEIGDGSGAMRPRRGWVSRSFLKDE